MIETPLVSVWMITYNHEKFIGQAIESVVQQDVNFEFELVIGDDKSTDQTRSIIKNYQSKYPRIIKTIFHETNIGIANNVAITLKACKGKYIALLEGDDYWIDKLKLKKQMAFLESNGSYSMCYTSAYDLYEDTGERKLVCNELSVITELNYLLSRGWFIRTATIFFKRDALPELPEWFFNSYSTDYILHILLGSRGKIAKMDDVTAVYRRHSGGISITVPAVQRDRWKQKIDTLNNIDEYLKFQYSQSVKQQIKEINWSIGFSYFRYETFVFNKFKGLKYFFEAGVTNVFKYLAIKVIGKYKKIKVERN